MNISKDKLGTTKFNRLVIYTPLVKSAAITVTEPVIGAKPSAPKTTSTGVTIENYAWYDDDGAISMTSTFEAGKTYKLWASLKPASGYIFTDSATATLNGNSVTPSSVNAQSMYFTYTFPKLELPKVSTINVTLTEPKEGAKPNTAISTSTEGVAVSSARVATSADTCKWYHGTDEMTDSETFAEGETYTARFMVRATSGYELADSPTVYVNSRTATYRSTLSTYRTYEISYTIPSSDTVSTVDISIPELTEGADPADFKAVSLTDGEIDLVDLLVLQKYLAGWSVTIVEANANVNLSGKPDIGVLTTLQKYLAGWNVKLGK